MLNEENGDDLKKPAKPLVYGAADNNGRPQLIQAFYNNTQSQQYSYYPNMPKQEEAPQQPEVINYIDKDPATLTPAQRIQRDIQIQNQKMEEQKKAMINFIAPKTVSNTKA